MRLHGPFSLHDLHSKTRIPHATTEALCISYDAPSLNSTSKGISDRVTPLMNLGADGALLYILSLNRKGSDMMR